MEFKNTSVSMHSRRFDLTFTLHIHYGTYIGRITTPETIYSGDVGIAQDPDYFATGFVEMSGPHVGSFIEPVDFPLDSGVYNCPDLDAYVQEYARQMIPSYLRDFAWTYDLERYMVEKREESSLVKYIVPDDVKSTKLTGDRIKLFLDSFYSD